MSECVALFTSAGAAAVSWSWSFASMGVGGWRGVRQGENQDAQCSAGRVASPRQCAALPRPASTPPASARIPPARGVREPPRAPGDRNKTAPGNSRPLHTHVHVNKNNHTATHNMLNSKSHTSLTHTHSKCIALSTQARPEPAETVCRSARHENASNSDTTHSTACLGHTHKPLTRPPRAGSWVSVRYLELNRPTLVRSSASLPSPAATRRASPSSACA
jgi:hypothetical protein